MKSWYPDEQLYAGAEHLNADYVAAYDDKAQFDPTGDIALLLTAGMSEHSVVVDLGAGTGAFSFAVSPYCHDVVAVDVSAAMVEFLCRKARTLGVTNVSVVHAGFLSFEHQGDQADVIFTRNALHQLPDFWNVAALEPMASVLRPGGIARIRDLIFDFDPSEADEPIESWMDGTVTDPAVGFTAGELAEYVQGEFSTYSWLFEQILDKVGLEVVDRSFVRSAYGAYTCVRRG
jgi:ubiquinone/menaquinone biosynthesis C-methylase UbiE